MQMTHGFDTDTELMLCHGVVMRTEELAQHVGGLGVLALALQQRHAGGGHDGMHPRRREAAQVRQPPVRRVRRGRLVRASRDGVPRRAQRRLAASRVAGLQTDALS